MIITINTETDGYWNLASKVRIALQEYGHDPLGPTHQCDSEGCLELANRVAVARKALLALRDFI